MFPIDGMPSVRTRGVDVIFLQGDSLYDRCFDLVIALSPSATDKFCSKLVLAMFDLLHIEPVSFILFQEPARLHKVC